MEVRRRIPHAHDDTDEETLVDRIKKVDTFEKLPRECVNRTSSGGGGTKRQFILSLASILTFGVIIVLIFAELSQFRSPDVVFNYSVDSSVEGDLPVNIDMTIAMRYVSMDVLDLNGNLISSGSRVKAINCKFGLPSRWSKKFKLKRESMNHLRRQYHSLHQYFWLSHMNSEEFALDTMHRFRENEVPEVEADACRFVGTFKVRKSPGNLHVTTGKALGLNSNVHIHIAPLDPSSRRNFSHRIHHLSFGTPLESYIHPLDAEEVISDDPALMYQYFIEVVPTTFRTRMEEIDTYQYAVTEQARSINHKNQSHGVPGVFFRYDVFPVRVEVDVSGGGSSSVARLLVRLSAIIGGVFATGNLLCLLLRASVCFCLEVRNRLKLATVTPGLSASAPLIPDSDDWELAAIANLSHTWLPYPTRVHRPCQSSQPSLVAFVWSFQKRHQKTVLRTNPALKLGSSVNPCGGDVSGD
ncbi:Endoplasmic reticulum-Golgi intermediate compartment protein 2 [Taenia crassiceps]|uniref:Endoplasmic reticulum-Golgi intermediate compartment protein 2 n=1 Tax=Taenia crassiceps TaxID=6207 RepID=A0ABR4QRB4_9CEST